MLAIAAPIVALMAELAPLISTTTAIGHVISVLTALVPAVITTANDLGPTIKNMIANLKSNAAVTPAQLDELDAIEAKLDADYDQASTAAGAEDAAADQKPTS